jgi:hypothetical protein
MVIKDLLIRETDAQILIENSFETISREWRMNKADY